jgi:hypothetical protein
VIRNHLSMRGRGVSLAAFAVFTHVRLPATGGTGAVREHYPWRWNAVKTGLNKLRSGLRVVEISEIKKP